MNKGLQGNADKAHCTALKSKMHAKGDNLTVIFATAS